MMLAVPAQKIAGGKAKISQFELRKFSVRCHGHIIPVARRNGKIGV